MIFSDWVRYLRLAARSVLRNKAACLGTAAILALGIGMSVAMFSLVDAVLIRPLPFPRQERIRVIWKVDPLAGRHVEELAYPELRDLQENIPDFEYAAVMPTSLYGYGQVLQTAKPNRCRSKARRYRTIFFACWACLLHWAAISASSDERVNAPPVVIVSDLGVAQSSGRGPEIIGRMIRLNGQGYTVIGVMAPGVEFPRGAGLWIPLGVERASWNVAARRFCKRLRASSPAFRRPHCRQVNALFHRLAADNPEATPVATRSGDAAGRILDRIGAPASVDHAGCVAAIADCLHHQLQQPAAVAHASRRTKLPRAWLGGRRGQISVSSAPKARSSRRCRRGRAWALPKRRFDS